MTANAFPDGRRVSVSVRDFNVFAGGGVLDDTDTIQKAIDWVESKGGGWVCFTDGTYMAKNIAMTSGVHFKGNGGVVKTLGTAVAEERLFYTTGDVERVKFRDMILDGNKGVVPGDIYSGVPLIELSFGHDATRIEVVDCELRNNGYIGFRCLSTANRIKVTGSEFYDVDACCWFGLAAQSNVRIYGNHFEEGLSEGVTVDLATGFDYSNFTISANTCLNKVSMVFTDGAINGLTVIGNTAIGTGVADTSGAGIRVDNGDGTPTNVTVTGNTVSGFGTGILLTGTNVTCGHNTVKDCRLEGILSSASRATIGPNTITDVNRGSGTPNRSPVVITSGIDVEVHGIVATDTAGTALHYSVIRVSSGTNVSVHDCKGKGFTDTGVYIDSSCVRAQVWDNDMRGGTTNPYFVESNDDTVVTKCRGNTSDQAGTFSIASNAVNIRAEDQVTLSNSGGGSGSTLQTLTTVSKARGRTITLTFAGISTISHAAGNIKTRTAADITTAAGSVYQAVSDGTDWMVLN
jgi:hypothetical protein